MGIRDGEYDGPDGSIVGVELGFKEDGMAVGLIVGNVLSTSVG